MLSESKRSVISPRGPNYILFSDVHLGADLVQHVRPWTVARLRDLAKVDRELGSMLDWYCEHRDPERPWKLVIAGDLVDFIGMNVAPLEGDALETELNDEERLHGLGSPSDHAAWKMRAVAARHPLMFEKLASFVAAGHSLVLVRGNHDLDFHWPTAQSAFVEAVISALPGDDAALRCEVASRIEFYPWFYYVEGLLYVEHGHQFDAMCSYHHLLAPISPKDPKRLSWSFSDWLLRSVSRMTPGLSSHGNDSKGAFDYVRLAASMGLRGAARLAYRYFAAIGRAIRLSREHLSEAARAVREENERRMAELADRMRLRLDQVRDLAALWPAPVTRGVMAVLRSMFLDRIALLATLVLVLATLVACGVPWPIIAATAAGLAGAYALYGLWATRLRRHMVDPTETMRRAARRIAELLPTRFVVMGHTHEPLFERIAEGIHYVNLGNWGVDDLDGDPGEAPRTHMVLRFVDGEPRAEFVRWKPGHGPIPALEPAS